MDNGPWIVLLVVLTITPILLIGTSNAGGVNQEEEPNDSFEDADRIWEGTTTGNVSISNTGNDTDFFAVSIPGHQTVRLSIDRDPGNGMSVFVSVFDRDGNLNSDLFILGDFLKNFRSDEWVNRADDPKDLIIRLSGEGSYTLKVEFIFVLSNFVDSYVNPLAVIGVMIVLIIGIFLGFYIARRGIKNQDQHMEKWSRTREKGKQRFILVFGLGYGILAGTMNILIHETVHTSRTPNTFWFITGSSFLIWTIGGFVLSVYSWKTNEKAYNKWVEEKKNEKRNHLSWGRPRSGSIRH
ncbi:MAG: hypothetical protein MUC62_04705 [Candidatus Thermoplasmatota archaeon]|jgi:hypothetical protein|nr:hypothetical protein [Candidatus Thermoplasmatota archaeon]